MTDRLVGFDPIFSMATDQFPSPPPQLDANLQGAVLTLTLQRPQALNSFTAALIDALRTRLEQAAADPAVRCVVITGSGRAFCAGQDLKDPAVAASGDVAADLGEVVARFYKPLMLCLRAMPVPTVAAVNGVAAGAGASLALACDVAIAKRSANFVQAFGAIGLVPDSGATWLLPRLGGRARALGMTLLGERVSAERAAHMGLIWSCVDDAVFDSEVTRTAERLAGLPTRALARTRVLIDDAQHASFAQALDAEAQAQSELGRGHDYAEGIAAFTQKRPPRFTDR